MVFVDEIEDIDDILDWLVENDIVSGYEKNVLLDLVDGEFFIDDVFYRLLFFSVVFEVFEVVRVLVNDIDVFE